MSNSAGGLFPDLHSGGFVMCLPIRRIVVLIWIEVEVRVLGKQPPRFSNSSVRTFERARQHELRSVAFKNSLSLLAGVLWQRELDLVAARGADPRVCNPGVSRSRIQDDFVRAQLT